MRFQNPFTVKNVIIGGVVAILVGVGGLAAIVPGILQIQGTPNGQAVVVNDPTVVTALGEGIELTGSLPGFATTPVFNMGSLNGAATSNLQSQILTALELVSTSANQASELTLLSNINTAVNLPIDIASGQSVTCNAGLNLNTSGLATTSGQVTAQTSFSSMVTSLSSMVSNLTSLVTNLGTSPMQSSGGSVGISGTLPAFAAIPSFKLTDGANQLPVKTGVAAGTGDNAIPVAISPNPAPECTKFIALNQTSGATVITGTASQFIYICSVIIGSATAQNFSIIEGTGTVCASGTPIGVIDGTTAGFPVSATGGFTAVASRPWLKGRTAADNICVVQSGSGHIGGVITYASAP